MSRTISASEAKNRFGAVMDWAIESEDGVIVQSHGEPKVAIISFEAYEEMRRLREMAQRERALERLRGLRDEVRARNQDLTAEQAEDIADRFSRLVIDDLASKGQVAFQE